MASSHACQISTRPRKYKRVGSVCVGLQALVIDPIDSWFFKLNQIKENLLQALVTHPRIVDAWSRLNKACLSLLPIQNTLGLLASIYPLVG